MWKTLRTTVLLLGPSLSPLAAQEPLAQEADLFYEAFYQEAALRDFSKAAVLYERFLNEAGQTAPRELLVRATAGRARALDLLGQTEVALAAWQGLLKLEPGHAEARAALVRAGQASSADQIDAEIRAEVQRLAGPQDAERAAQNLRLYGPRAVPALLEGLAGARDTIEFYCALVLTDLALQGVSEASQGLALHLNSMSKGARDNCIDRMLSMTILPACHSFYRAGQTLENADERASFVGRLWRGILAGDAAIDYGIYGDEFRELFLQATSDPAVSVRVQLLSRLLASRALYKLPPQSEDIAENFIERAWHSSVQAEAALARKNALSEQRYFQKHSDELLPLILRGDFADQAPSNWVQRALAENWLTQAQVFSLLDDKTEIVRALAWHWLVEHAREQDGGTLAELAPRATQAARDWLVAYTRAYGHGLDDFAEDFGDFELPFGDLASMWNEYASLSDSSGLRLHPRHLLLDEFSRRITNEESANRALQAALGALTDANDRLEFLRAWLSTHPRWATVGFFLDVARDPAAELRSLAYDRLNADVFSLEQLPEDWELRTLLDDIAQGADQAARFAQLIASVKLRSALAQRATSEMDAEGRARLLGVWAGIGPESEVRQAVQGLAQDQRQPSEDVLKAFWHMFKVTMPARESRTLDALLLVAADQPRLLLALLRDPETVLLPFANVTRLVELALGQAELEQSDLLAALVLTEERNLSVPLQTLLPYLRHSSVLVRERAEVAVEQAQRMSTLERLALSFGEAEARQSLERIQQSLRSKDPSQRRGAAYAIAALGDPTGVGLLLGLLEDPAAEVRAAALEALERMGGKVKLGD